MSNIPFVGWIALIVFALGALLSIRASLATAKLTAIRNEKTMESYYKDLREKAIDPVLEEELENKAKAEAEKLRSEKQLAERQARLDDERLLMKEWADTMRQLHAEGIQASMPVRSFSTQKKSRSNRKPDRSDDVGQSPTTAT